MLNNDKTGLWIFDGFQVDFNLPKWKERREKTNDGTSPLPFFTRNRGGMVAMPMDGFSVSSSAGLVPLADSGTANTVATITLWDKIFNRKKIKKQKEAIEEAYRAPNFKMEDVKESTPEMSVEDFFKSVKNSAEELVIVKERMDNYEKAIKHLNDTGQVALRENMSNELEIHRAETQLFAIGKTKVITEENMVDFAKKSSRALKLDWVQNFTRLIPQKVVEQKLICDQRHIFDNYVVCHYDPKNTGTQDTEAEKIKKKDPILFGVIAGSQKLYYIGDWIDEYCDLTFDKLVEELGDKAVTANDITSNVEIKTEA